jgi:hypothetical protein
MIVKLDHQQRLNLIALMGTQRGNVAELRLFWDLQDRLELNDEERAAIRYRVAVQNGVEVPSWDPEAKLPVLEYEISEVEGQRLRRVIEEWPHFLTAMDRKWILPLLDQLPAAAPAPTSMPMPMPMPGR